MTKKWRCGHLHIEGHFIGIIFRWNELVWVGCQLDTEKQALDEAKNNLDAVKKVHR